MNKPTLELPQNLQVAQMISRPNRFVLKCRTEEGFINLYLPDPGRLPLIIKKDRIVYYLPTNDNNRKTKGSVVLVKLDDDNFVSMNSHLANDLAELGLNNEYFKEFKGYNIEKREFGWSNSRLDFLLKNKEDNRKKLLLEVKSVNLVDEGTACFPDAPTKRGTRHLNELIKWNNNKDKRAGVLFIIQQENANSFRPCREIDPEFALVLNKARDKGIIVAVYDTLIDLHKIKLNCSVFQIW